jgi:hypothetical protein
VMYVWNLIRATLEDMATVAAAAVTAPLWL